MTPYLKDANITASLSLEARALLEQRSKALGEKDKLGSKRRSGSNSRLSFAQEAIWLSTELDKSTSAYNRCWAIRLTGHLDGEALNQSIREIARRHEILRSRLSMVGDEPVFEVLPATAVDMVMVDVSSVADNDRQSALTQAIHEEIRKPFDLHAGPFIRAVNFAEDDETNTLCITTHHIASDGWSDGVFFRELNSIYSSFIDRTLPSLIEPPRQYSEFAEWQRERASGPEIERNVEYWSNRMAGAPLRQNIPTDRPRPSIPEMAAGVVRHRVPPRIVRSLDALARAEGATAAITMLAGFQLFQFRITGEQDAVVGLSLAGRTRRQDEEVIGPFSLVVPVRVQIDRTMTFRKLLGSVRATALEGQAHQQIPLDALLRALPSAHGVPRPEIAETIFNFRNMPAFAPSLPALEAELIETFNGNAVADLELEVIEDGASWECALRFRTALFDEATAARLLGHYVTLLESIAVAPDELVGRLQIMTPSERRQVLVDFNGRVQEFPECRGLHYFLTRQAKLTPSAIAMSFAEGSMTYSELDRCSDALGRELKSRGVVAGDRVGICIERSPQMIVAVLAALKAGAAFVPLDPDLPPGRLGLMLSDTVPRVLLADKTGSSLLAHKGVDLLLVGADWLTGPDSTQEPFSVEIEDDQVACVLYTSGSTGLPKGVLSTHRGIVNNLRAMQDMYPITSEDCMLQQTSLGFDAAAWEIFWPISVGARFYVASPGGQRDAAYVLEMIAANGISTVGFAPSMLKVMAGMEAFTRSEHIKRVLSYGEVLSPGLQDALFARMPNVELCNLYGPAEAAIIVTAWTCERHSGRHSVPLGSPVSNTEIYLLDAGFEPVPVGVEGEIVIGGVCVANGYHNRPDLTAERFVPHPFRPESGDKVYRTGDIARFGADGVIEYVGRRDNQMKVRGIRVELEEIEAALVQVPGVRLGVVVPRRESDEWKLIAYAEVRDSAVTPGVIRSTLENALPPQFIPAQIICLPKLPLNINGKVDRSRLPDPSEYVNQERLETASPRTELEIQLSRIWEEIIGAHDFGVRDSFFNLGGHSLTAVRMLQRASDDVGKRISLRAFYADPTVRGLARLISGSTSNVPGHESAQVLKVKEARNGAGSLFYMHGQPASGGGYALKFTPFLPPDLGFSILPVPIFDEPAVIEDVAAKMISLMRAEQPRGPYLLGGNCFGAVLAYEMALQLKRNGERVSLLVLVHPETRTPLHAGFKAMRRLALFAGLDDTAHNASFAGAFSYTGRMVGQIVGVLRRDSWRERLRRIAEAARYVMHFIAKHSGKPIETGSEAGKDIARETEEIVSCVNPTPHEIKNHADYVWDAWQQYAFQPYNGRTAFIWPMEGPANPPWNPRLLWDKVVPKSDWYFVHGNHWNMLFDHIEDSARAIGVSIERGMEPWKA
jgi:amino acid adenylation domain-containing protein